MYHLAFSQGKYHGNNPIFQKNFIFLKNFIFPPRDLLLQEMNYSWYLLATLQNRGTSKVS